MPTTVAEMSDDPPLSLSKQDVCLFEVFAAEDGAFRRTLFTQVDALGQAWAGEVHGIRKYDLTTEHIGANLQRIPDEDVFPEATADMTPLAELHDTTGLFLKRPQIHGLLDEFGGSIVPQMLLEEAQTMELLAQHPHPNNVRYFGCDVRRGRITGIALPRYEMILDRRFREDTSSLDLDRFERQCREAINHIHSLGIAHNALNPSNIALDDHDNPVLIDWGSCKKFGELLLSAGTPGWIEDDFDISRQEHDLVALEKIMAWMRTEKSNAMNRPGNSPTATALPLGTASDLEGAAGASGGKAPTDSAGTELGSGNERVRV